MSERDQERDEAIARLRELAKQLPYERPDASRVDAVRSSLLLAATTPEAPARSRWFVVGGAFAIGALAAAAAILLVVGTGSRPSTSTTPDDHRSWIEASTAADFERQITRSATGIDEVVRIRSGRMSLSVGTLAAGERVRLATGDAEVEGQGRYEVAVTADSIRELTVKEGSATLRIAHQSPIFLAAGQTWRAPVVTADLQPDAGTRMEHVDLVPPAADPRPDAGPDTMPSRGPSTRPDDRPHAHASARPETPETPTPASTLPAAEATSTSTSDSTPKAEPTPTTIDAKPARRELERHFEAGMQLLKAGKSAEAARELGAAADAGADDPLAADARYFQAVALTKAGRKTEAEAALIAFLDHAPRALRRGRAAVMLARLIAERGDTASARAWFESATHDADPAVAAAATAGLAKLAPAP